jgi:signal transduction histidine kinase
LVALIERRARVDYFWLVIVLGIAIFMLFTFGGTIQKRIEWLLHDTALRVKDTPARGDVVLIDLDRFSDGPNPSDSVARREHATRALGEICRQKPKVVVVTIGLFELEGAARVFEKQKVDVLKFCPVMVAPAIIVDESKRPFAPPASPVKEYSQYLAGVGHDLVLGDADGTTRRMFPWWDFGNGPMRSVALTAAAFGAPPGWRAPEKPKSNLFATGVTEDQDLASYTYAVATPPIVAVNADMLTDQLGARVMLQSKFVVVHGSAYTHTMPLAHPSASAVSFGVIIAQELSALLDQRVVSSSWTILWGRFGVGIGFVSLMMLPIIGVWGRFIGIAAVSAGMLSVQYLAFFIGGVELNPSAYFMVIAMGLVLWAALSAIRTKRALSATITSLSMVNPLAAATQLRAPAAQRQNPIMSGTAMLRSLEDTSRYMQGLAEVLGEGVNVLPSAIAWVDQFGRVSLANARFATLAGIRTAKESIGLDCATLLNDRSMSAGFRLGAPCLHTQQKDIEFITRDGRVYLVNHTLAPSNTPRGVSGSIVSATEITALRAAQGDYHNAVTFLSHDLRSPVAALVSNAQQVSANTGSSLQEIKDRTTRIEQLSRLVLSMTDQFLALARVQSSNRAEFLSVSLVDVAGDVQADLQAIAADRGSRIELIVEADSTVRGDRMLIQRAIQNLVGNAIRFSPSNSSVVIRVGLRHMEQGESRFESAHSIPFFDVSDAGAGLSKLILDHLQIDGSSGKVLAPLPSSDGHGFGLLLVQNVARLHGAKVRAENLVDGKSGCVTGARIGMEFLHGASS